MPNDCLNSIIIDGTNENISSFENFLAENDGKKWSDFFIQSPVEFSESWCLENLGTSKVCDTTDWSRESVTRIQLSFNSSQTPPIKLYETILVDETYSVDAHHYIPDLSIVGYFNDGVNEQYEFTDYESLDSIPEEVLNFWSIRQTMAPFDDDGNPV
jgi:hypothetical protein